MSLAQNAGERDRLSVVVARGAGARPCVAVAVAKAFSLAGVVRERAR